MDWHRGDLTHRVSVLQVDPTNLVDVRGELRGVTGGRIDLQYYGDTRMGAELVTTGDHGWDGSAALRVVHTVSDSTGALLVESLFTGFVTATSWSDGGDSVTWTLNSCLYALQVAVADLGYSVAKGSKALSVAAQMCAALGRPCRIESTANEYIFGTNRVYEAGQSYLSMLLDVCDASGNRLTVDADGVVVVGGYVVPSTRGVDFDADERDPRGMVVGPVSGDAIGLDTPARVIVRAEDGDKSVTGIASVASGAPSSAGVRGFRLDRFENGTDVSPFTQQAATAKAQELLAKELATLPSISHGLMYLPLREGDIERLTRRDGSTARWMVSGASLDLTQWTWSLEMKGGWQ